MKLLGPSEKDPLARSAPDSSAAAGWCCQPGAVRAPGLRTPGHPSTGPMYGRTEVLGAGHRRTALKAGRRTPCLDVSCRLWRHHSLGRPHLLHRVAKFAKPLFSVLLEQLHAPCQNNYTVTAQTQALQRDRLTGPSAQASYGQRQGEVDPRRRPIGKLAQLARLIVPCH